MTTTRIFWKRNSHLSGLRARSRESQPWHGLLAKTPGLGGLGFYSCFRGIGVTPGLNPTWSRSIFLVEMRGVRIPFGVREYTSTLSSLNPNSKTSRQFGANFLIQVPFVWYYHTKGTYDQNFFVISLHRSTYCIDKNEYNLIYSIYGIKIRV